MDKTINTILADHEALKYGNQVIYYDNQAFRVIEHALIGWCQVWGTARDYEVAYRPWGDGVHASCFFAWLDRDTKDYLEAVSFDCYV